jgi:V8-like Glu-specific endopeptidase
MKAAASLLCVLFVALSGSVRAATQVAHKAALWSGALSNPTGETQERVIGVLRIPGASVLRIPLSGAVLGKASKVRFVSLRDGQSQTLDAAQLAMWGNASALFNGDAVRVEVILAPGDRDVAVRVREVFSYKAGLEPQKGTDDLAPETLCGSADERVGSNDNRVGRLNGNCTGWLVSNGAVLTAGHCGIAGGNIFEVNIPASQPNGTTTASAVQDQFPVVGGSITLSSNGIGDDWQVFTLGPNNLNQLPHELHGFFRMITAVPAAGATTRVTGCGVDNTPAGTNPSACANFNAAGVCTHPAPNAQNQTLQTATGAFAALNGTTLTYSVDTEPANSGSPIIWDANGFTIGIHTAGGCTSTGGSNNGTSFSLATLENAIAAIPGPDTRYLDTLRTPDVVEDGSIFRPHDTLAEAVAAVPVGGRISVVRGNYAAAGTTITKAMTLSAPVGAVVFGN